MPQPLIQTDLLKKLASLRRKLRSRLAAEGVARLVLAVVAAIFFTMGVDFLLRLERPLRVGDVGAICLDAGRISMVCAGNGMFLRAGCSSFCIPLSGCGGRNGDQSVRRG